MRKTLYLSAIATTMITLSGSTDSIENIVSCVNQNRVDIAYSYLPTKIAQKNPKKILEQEIIAKLSKREIEQDDYNKFIQEKISKLPSLKPLDHKDISDAIYSIEDKLWVDHIIGIQKDYVAIRDNYKLSSETTADIKQYEDFQTKLLDVIKNDIIEKNITLDKLGEKVQKVGYDFLPTNTPEERKEYLVEITKEIIQEYYKVTLTLKHQDF
jgi:hypothetical protein